MKYRKPKEDPESDDYDSESDTSSEDDEYDHKYNSTKGSSFSCFGGTSKIAYYFLLGLVLLSSLAFLNERDLRLKLMSSSTLVTPDSSPFDVIEEASRKDLANNPSTDCPECPSCEDSNEAAALPTDMEEIANAWRGRNQRLQAQVQSFAKILLESKFGKSPYFVEFAINVDTEEGVKMNGEITIELNNAEYLPYSTYYFLSQISAGVWNNCGFFISLGVVYLDEARGPEYGGSCDRTAFASSPALRELGIPEFLAMQEYHPNVYHDVHSLGMSGRPGGMGLYFNAQVSNSRYYYHYYVCVVCYMLYEY